MRIISMLNQKGGVGKTVTTLNLGAMIQNLYPEKRVLLIDIDPQCNLSDIRNSGFNANGIYQVLRGDVQMDDVIIRGDDDIPDLIPSNLMLAQADLEFIGLNRAYILKKAINKLKAEYDYIIIDCPPSLNVLTINALVASTDLIIPVRASKYSIAGIGMIFQTLSEVREVSNPDIHVLGIVINGLKENTNIGRFNRDEIEKAALQFGTSTFKTYIHESVSIEECVQNQATLIGTGSKPEEDFKNLAEEVIERIGD